MRSHKRPKSVVHNLNGIFSKLKLLYLIISWINGINLLFWFIYVLHYFLYMKYIWYKNIRTFISFRNRRGWTGWGMRGSCWRSSRCKWGCRSWSGTRSSVKCRGMKCWDRMENFLKDINDTLRSVLWNYVDYKVIFESHLTTFEVCVIFERSKG